jgi:hypothetical protein
MQCLLSSWSKNFKFRTLTKCQSPNILLSVNIYNFYFFWFHFLDLLIKFMKMRLLYILYCSPTPARWVQGYFVPFAILHAPIYRSSPPPPPAHLGGGGGGPITRSRFWLARGEGGDRCNTTTCRMAKDTKDTCICHVGTSHAKRPRTESSLLFVTFLYCQIMSQKLGSLTR